MEYQDIESRLSELVDKIRSSAREIHSTEAGLDSRCGWLLVDPNWVASEQPRYLDYYGGFEYLDPEDSISVGGLKVYMSGNERVDAVLESLENED